MRRYILILCLLFSPFTYIRWNGIWIGTQTHNILTYRCKDYVILIGYNDGCKYGCRFALGIQNNELMWQHIDSKNRLYQKRVCKWVH